DMLETFILNLSRKTGIRGLTGIKEKSGYIIRPMLFASRSEIEEYARLNFIEKHEDSTNSEVVYQRNFIRHRVLPALSELNPAFRMNLVETISNLKGAEEVYLHWLDSEKEESVSVQDETVIIDIGMLCNSPFPKLLLYEILAEYNFNHGVAAQA